MQLWLALWHLVDGSQEGLQQVLIPGLLLPAGAVLSSPGAADVAQQGCRAHNGCLTRQGLQRMHNN